MRDEAKIKEKESKVRRIIVGVLIELFIGLGTILYLIFCVVLLIISKIIESKPENENYSSSVAILIGIGLYVPMWNHLNTVCRAAIGLFNDDYFKAEDLVDNVFYTITEPSVIIQDDPEYKLVLDEDIYCLAYSLSLNRKKLTQSVFKENKENPNFLLLRMLVCVLGVACPIFPIGDRLLRRKLEDSSRPFHGGVSDPLLI